jgi:hypothetical protein
MRELKRRKRRAPNAIGISSCVYGRFNAALQLTFFQVVAGYEYEGAHSIYLLVHPFCPLLAGGVARGGSFAGGLAGVAAAPSDRNYREGSVCFDSRDAVFAGAVAGWEKDLAERKVWNVEQKAKAWRLSWSIGGCFSP